MQAVPLIGWLSKLAIPFIACFFMIVVLSLGPAGDQKFVDLSHAACMV
jgi:hypothetical protein